MFRNRTVRWRVVHLVIPKVLRRCCNHARQNRKRTTLINNIRSPGRRVRTRQDSGKGLGTTGEDVRGFAPAPWRRAPAWHRRAAWRRAAWRSRISRTSRRGERILVAPGRSYLRRKRCGGTVCEEEKQVSHSWLCGRRTDDRGARNTPARGFVTRLRRKVLQTRRINEDHKHNPYQLWKMPALSDLFGCSVKTSGGPIREIMTVPHCHCATIRQDWTPQIRQDTPQLRHDDSCDMTYPTHCVG